MTTIPDNYDYTPLQQAAREYTIKRSSQIEMPSASTVSDLLYDAFIEGALWTLKNPVLTSDVERQRRCEPAQTASGG